MPDNRKLRLFEDTAVPKAVFTLSIPTVISSLVALLYSLADTYFVGMLNDPIQTAAVTLAAPVLLAFNAVNNLFGVGGSSMMSRALGRGDMKTLRQSSAFGFYGALFSGIVYSLACTALLTPLLGLLGADAATTPATARYMLWTVCLGATPSILNVVMAYLIRSEGATLHASIGTMSGCLMNIVLDPLFILPSGFGMGAEGAALATLLSNCFATLYFFFYLFWKRKSTYVCISLKEFTLRREIVGGVCAVGVPASIQNLLNVLSHMLLNNMAAPFGAAALAGMGIASKISMVPWYISNGISQGVMPLIGYTYAAKLLDRMKRTLSFTVKLSQGILCTLALLCCLLSKQITGAFINDAQTVAYGSSFLYGMALSIPFLGMDFLAIGVFQAVGKGSFSLLMAILRKLAFEIPALFVLNALWPLYGLSCAQLFAEICMAVVGSALLIRLLKRINAESRC
ncbi:MAG: MATE family efflux transporter [Clostridiales bacterium]|nr:MATE family efflux transporter [Clostridiales bacterium]MDO4349157.1 MATE family efflux transporter [Eubacteriales bacterium]MDY4007856.1 MATE family efflux transporter [Candidatus Limiplasma sp.]